LLSAFVQAGVAPRWSEYLAHDTTTPEHARGFASPTVLVDGRDIVDATASDHRACRTYADASGRTSGVPPIEAIVDALRRAHVNDAVLEPRPRWRSALAMLPAIGTALLPKVACPACWPAYAGVLGALGLGVLMDTAVLLPLTATFLLLAVGALGFRARARRGYRPLALGIVAAAIVLLGKFAFESDGAMYVGLGILVVASLWNSWPRPRIRACPACPPSA
jgi:hypothetical protein